MERLVYVTLHMLYLMVGQDVSTVNLCPIQQVLPSQESVFASQTIIGMLHLSLAIAYSHINISNLLINVLASLLWLPTPPVQDACATLSIRLTLVVTPVSYAPTFFTVQEHTTLLQKNVTAMVNLFSTGTIQQKRVLVIVLI